MMKEFCCLGRAGVEHDGARWGRALANAVMPLGDRQDALLVPGSSLALGAGSRDTPVIRGDE
jgi:hypothetical protein